MPPCFPSIRVTTDQQTQYDRTTSQLLRKAVAEYSNFHGHVDTDDWTPVRKKKQMTIYRSNSGTREDPQVTLLVGTGLLPGSLEDVMDGLYADTTEDFCVAKTIATDKFIDGAVLNVSEKRTPDAPFRFAGIRWSAARAAWGMVKHRDILTYERMGTTIDANGNELAFHVLQSIERPDWIVDAIKGIKRAQTATCYIYKRVASCRVQCFVWSEIYDVGSATTWLAERVIAGALLSVVRSVECAEAKKLSKLIHDARGAPLPTTQACHMCYKSSLGVFDHLRTCVGCVQRVCKTCSQHRIVLEIDSRTHKPLSERFCKICIAKVVSSPLAVHASYPLPASLLRQSVHSDPGAQHEPLSHNMQREKARSAPLPSRFLALPRHIKQPLMGSYYSDDTLSSDEEEDMDDQDDRDFMYEY